MGIAKYRYYSFKPKSEIVKDVFSWLFVAGAVVIAATSPYFIVNLLRTNEKFRKYQRRKIHDAFISLRRRGLLRVYYQGRQMHIALTKEGKKKAGIFQIDSLRISEPRQWDKKWRILMFDIQEMKKMHREALRGKLKQLGFFPLQKSVWAHPFDCRAEIELLRDFFGLSQREMCLIIAEHVEHDREARKFFNL